MARNRRKNTKPKRPNKPNAVDPVTALMGKLVVSGSAPYNMEKANATASRMLNGLHEKMRAAGKDPYFYRKNGSDQ